MSEVSELNVLRFKEKLDLGEALAVLDVREPHEREHASIGLPETAVDLFVPMGQVAARACGNPRWLPGSDPGRVLPPRPAVVHGRDLADGAGDRGGE